MATVLPPPSKRQKTAIAEKTQKQQDVEIVPSGLGSIRVQFSSQANGQPVGTPVSVPVADATIKNLELLLNTIQGNVRTQSSICSTFKKNSIRPDKVSFAWWSYPHHHCMQLRSLDSRPQPMTYPVDLRQPLKPFLVSCLSNSDWLVLVDIRRSPRDLVSMGFTD